MSHRGFTYGRIDSPGPLMPCEGCTRPALLYIIGPDNVLTVSCSEHMGRAMLHMLRLHDNADNGEHADVWDHTAWWLCKDDEDPDA